MIKLASRYTVARDSGARRLLRSVFKSGEPISIHEIPVPADAGLRLGRAERRPRTRRHRPEVQPAGRPRTAEAVRPGQQCILTMPLLEGLDGVEKMSKSKNNYIGISEKPARHVRQADEHFRHADVALLRTAVVPSAWTRSRRSRREAEGGPQSARLQGHAGPGNRRAFSFAGVTPSARSKTSTYRAKGGVPDDIPAVALAGAPLAIGQLLKQAGSCRRRAKRCATSSRAA